MNSRLISCKTCHQEISPEAAACPHCGAPNKKKRGWAAKIGIGVAVVIMAAVGSCVFDGNSGNGSNATAASSGAGASGQTSHRLNEPVATGTMEWTITGVRVAAEFSNDGASVQAESDQSVLVLVSGTVTNRSDEEVTHLGNLFLVDDHGARYGEKEEGALVAQPLALTSFNPNVPKQFSTIFEVPRAASGLKFEATDFGLVGAETALIELGLKLQ